MRAALVDYFRDEAAIMIATEAAAEGINLQFCNLVVNYDLPWNPQRIEQRIGRCHRYGQKFDVVVVNFLNKKNAADQRVYRAARREVPTVQRRVRRQRRGAGRRSSRASTSRSASPRSTRIAARRSRSQFEFDQLQRDLEAEIARASEMRASKLLDNFDQEVVEKVRIQSQNVLDRFNERLWQLTRHLLARLCATSMTAATVSCLHDNPFAGEPIHPGPYRMGKGVEDANTYRVGSPAGAASARTREGRGRIRQRGDVPLHGTAARTLPSSSRLVGKSGWLEL